MSLAKTPTSALSGPELLAKMIWYRTKNYKRLLSKSDAPQLATLPPVYSLPQELVKKIISYLFYDIKSLHACSLTCYSWYSATLPHLYFYLTIDQENQLDRENKFKYLWPRPLIKMNTLGLLPSVKQLCIRHTIKFTPERLSSSTLRYFSALKNLQELGIDGLQVSSFMPTIQQCFGHFAPTLRFLALKDPRGSSREILYFIGLFPNLQDLKICYPFPEEGKENRGDSALVPLSTPPLRGRLILTCFTREELMKDMITYFGRPRFRHMDLFMVMCTRLLLSASADTLETLRLYPTDLYANIEALRLDFNLSQNKSLRTLETTIKTITFSDDAAGFLKTVLSTAAPSLLLDVVIIYKEAEFGYRWDQENTGPLSADKKAGIVKQHLEWFKVLREMYSVRNFRLVLCADVIELVEKHAMGILERVVEVEESNGGLRCFKHGVSIICDKRTPQIRYRGLSSVRELPIYASAL